MRQIPLSSEFIRGLVEAEETYRHLVEGIPAAVYVDAPDELSTNLYTSPQIEAILGYSPADWTARPDLWFSIMHPDDVDRVAEEDRKVSVTGERFRAEYRLRARDGRWVWLRDEAVIVRDEAGEPLFWRGIMLDVSEQKEAEEKLRRSLDALRRTMEERRQLLFRLEEAREEERRRIAEDIHDDPIQAMSAADMRLRLLADESAGTEVGRAIEDVHMVVTDAIERLRNLLFELRPPALDHEGLSAALRQYLKYSEAMKGLLCELDDRLESEPPAEMQATLFRIAQEALANIRKHAEARRVGVLLESVDDGVLIRVTDDGKGFDVTLLHRPAPGHLGLSSLLERAQLAGGWGRVDTRPGAGTSVECWLPRYESGADRSA